MFANNIGIDLDLRTNLSGAIVEFRIPGYPEPSNECGTEVRLKRGKIFRGNIRM